MIRELLLGPTYFYHQLLIKKSKKWSSIEVENYKNNNIINDGEEIVYKQDMLASPKEYLKKCFLVPLRNVRTGGTTGEPFIFKQDIIFTRQKERAYLFDIWSNVGYNPFDYRIVVRGNIPKGGIKYSFIENALIISQDFFCKENYETLKNNFFSKPFFLHVYPSTLIFLIEFWGEELFQKFPIKGVLAGSEAFPNSQMKWFKDKFDIQISHWYGHSEYAILARFCNECHEFHFYPTYGRVAILEKDNEVLIIANSLNKYGTVFKNYFTGDLAVKSKVVCEEDNFFKVNRVIGRNQEFIYDKENRRKAFGPYLFGIHNQFWDYVLYVQFIQNEIGKVTITYVPSKKHNNAHFKKIVGDRFLNYSLSYKEVSFNKKSKSGKHAYFKQKIKFD